LNYKRIKKECLMFEECYEMVVQKSMTGSPTENDIITVATAVFNCKDNITKVYDFWGDNPVTCGAQFKYLNCYLWMRNQYLWKMIRNAKEMSQPIPIPENDGPIHPVLSNVNTNRDTHSSSPPLSPVESNAPLLSTVTPMPQPLSTGTSEEHISNNSSEPKLPVGAKKTIEKRQLTSAINKSTKLFEELLEQNKKKTEVAQSFMEIMRALNEVEKQREEREFFNSEGVPEDVRKKYIEYRTKKSIEKWDFNVRDEYTTKNIDNNNDNDEEVDPNSEEVDRNSNLG
ncbi:MAG: hypothetical protein AAGG81_09250, partial [Chlamydiota bacterium]